MHIINKEHHKSQKMKTLIFLVFTIFSVTFVAAQDTGEGEVVVLAESASPVDNTIPVSLYNLFYFTATAAW